MTVRRGSSVQVHQELYMVQFRKNYVDVGLVVELVKQFSCHPDCFCLMAEALLGELSLGLGCVHSITRDGRQFLAAVILIVDVVGDVL